MGKRQEHGHAREGGENVGRVGKCVTYNKLVLQLKISYSWKGEKVHWKYIKLILFKIFFNNINMLIVKIKLFLKNYYVPYY